MSELKKMSEKNKMTQPEKEAFLTKQVLAEILRTHVGLYGDSPIIVADFLVTREMVKDPGDWMLDGLK